MRKFKALIIGAGNIGALFDSPKSKNIITHAHAYSVHPGFELIGFVNPDPKNAKKAVKIWGGKAYSSIEEAFNKEPSIDVVSVCAPDEHHGKIIKEIAEKTVDFIFAEKPITKSLKEAREVIDICNKNKVPLQVNYSRRFVPEIQALAREIKAGTYGTLTNGIAYYGKGIMHNGSHMMDLIRFLLGEVKFIKATDKINDFYDDDPTVSAILTLDNGEPIYLRGINCQNFTIFELDLIFQKGRVTLNNSGYQIERYLVQENKLFKGYRYLSKPKESKTSLDKAMYCAVENIHEYLVKKKPLLCSKEEGYLSLKAAIEVKEA
jgi:predicted dehydrogenase